MSLLGDRVGRTSSLSTFVSTSSETARDGYDAAATICAFLVLRGGLSSRTLAQHLRLPPFVILESVRTGESSKSLRGALNEWLLENRKSVTEIPSALLKSLSDACAVDAVSAHEDDQDDMENILLHVLDPITRQHFGTLQHSVGQSFISILNDPGERQENSDWSSWLGGKVFDAFDYNGRSSRSVDEALATLRTNVTSESSSSLIASHQPQTDFGEYVSLVSSAYATNRSEGKLMSRAATIKAEHGRSQQAELPWPQGVPQEFFDRDYRFSTVVEELAEAHPDLAVTYDGRGVAAEGVVTQSVPPGTVSLADFVRDVEYLEQRNKQLRQWETAVDECLLRHAQNRSEDFFASSQQFRVLSEAAEEAWQNARDVRSECLRRGSTVIHEYFRIGSLHRRRDHFLQLHSVVSKVQLVLRDLADIENWTALPERDIGELRAYILRLLDLEAFLKGTSNSHLKRSQSSSTAASHDTWETLSGLKCMRMVPKRTATARTQLEHLVHLGAFTSLKGDMQSPALWPRSIAAFESATLLGIFESVLQSYKSDVVRTQWTSIQEVVVGFLMASGDLDDTAANELLSVTMSHVATIEERRSLLSFCGNRPFAIYMGMFAKIVEQLMDGISSISQSWGYFLVECLPHSLASHENPKEITRNATIALFATLCEEAEQIVALYVEVRDTSKKITNIVELQHVVRGGYGFLSLLLEPLVKLSALLPAELDGIDKEMGVGKAIRLATYKIAKRFLKAQHISQMKKLRIVVESETWTPREDIDAIFQAHVEGLCASDDKSIKDFQGTSVESTRGGAMNEYYSCMLETSQQQVISRSHRTRADAADDLMNLKSNRLYLSLDGGDGRVVGSSFLILTELLHDYDNVLALFPSLAFDMVTRMYEMTAFYDRLCAKMVLGAGATEHGTLKTITTQNLCVGSQCVAMLAEVITKVQQRLLRVLHEQDTTTTADVHGQTHRNAGRLRPFIEGDFGHVIKDCNTHRDEFFQKMCTMVLSKVDGLSAMEGSDNWSTQGNEWVMTMLREAARLMRTIGPLLPASDVQGVMAPLLGSFAARLRAATCRIPSSATDARAMAVSDVLLFKVNVEHFGYDVLGCAALDTVSAAMGEGLQLKPCSSDVDVLQWFFP